MKALDLSDKEFQQVLTLGLMYAKTQQAFLRHLKDSGYAIVRLPVEDPDTCYLCDFAVSEPDHSGDTSFCDHCGKTRSYPIEEGGEQ